MAMFTKLEMVTAYEKGSPPTMVTQHNSNVTIKASHVTVFTWLMTTKQGDGLWYWAIIHKVA